MLDLFPEGFEEVERADALELAVYTNGEGERRVRAAFGGGAVLPVAAGWEHAWKRFHRPVRAGPLWIGPSWEEPDERAIVVTIDPGRAFGTGAHPTTRLCLELLLACEPTSLVDLGCGSGVLAIAAAKLGFGPVVALDSDEAAVAAARRNADVNAVAIDVWRSDVLAEPLPAAGVAVANMTLAAVERVASRLRSRRFIASGYLARDRPALRRWSHRRRIASEGWAADLFEAR